jgi:hypothetical protein
VIAVQGTATTFNVLTNDGPAATEAEFSRAPLSIDAILIGRATGPAPASPNYGSVTCVDVGADRGLCTYRSADLFIGTDGFDYALSRAGRIWNVHVSIDVTARTDAPVARDDRAVATTGGPLVTISPLSNDTDANTANTDVALGTLIITAADTIPPASGTLSCSETDCTFAPPTTGFTGFVTVQYTLVERSASGTDGPGSSATITIYVDAAPILRQGFTASARTDPTVSIGHFAGSTSVTSTASDCVAGHPVAAITWSPNAMATSWIVERRQTEPVPGEWIRQVQLAAPATSYIDDRLGEDHTYQWRVRANFYRWSGVYSEASTESHTPAALSAVGC